MDLEVYKKLTMKEQYFVKQIMEDFKVLGDSFYVKAQGIDVIIEDGIPAKFEFYKGLTQEVVLTARKLMRMLDSNKANINMREEYLDRLEKIDLRLIDDKMVQKINADKITYNKQVKKSKEVLESIGLMKPSKNK